MNTSSIEWTESTWNPIITGCDKVSPGCKNCYAEIMALRLKAMPQLRYKNGFKFTLHGDKVDEPRKWKKGKLIFVNSMSDLFHKDVPLEFIQKVFKTMSETPQHTYQILTKRSKRLLELSPELEWSDNIWMGVSIENDDYLYRLENLKLCEAKIKWISAEPLLGSLANINLSGIDWCVVGGESGPKSRPMEKQWVIEIKDQCEIYNVSFFFKQWGGRNKKKAGNLLDGVKYEAYPEAIQLNI